jgi:rhodanese-related sulfurtransferase
MYKLITPQEAKRIMENCTDCIILDVRRPDEFEKGHIQGAINIPHTEISDRAQEVLKDKDALILVYCRSGRRSKFASQLLANMRYTNIHEFGGILDWPYEVVKD